MDIKYKGGLPILQECAGSYTFQEVLDNEQWLIPMVDRFVLLFKPWIAVTAPEGYGDGIIKSGMRGTPSDSRSGSGWIFLYKRLNHGVYHLHPMPMISHI